MPQERRASDDHPTLQHHFNWNETNLDWDSTWRANYAYDQNGRILSRQIDVYNAPTWLPSTRETKNYPGDSTYTLLEIWNGFAWDYSSRTIEAHDQQGRLSFQVSLNWQGNSWDTASGIRYAHSYGSQNKLVASISEIYSPFTQSWTNNTRFSLRYAPAALEPDTMRLQSWIANGWEDQVRWVNILWYDFAEDRALHWEQENNNNGNWVLYKTKDCFQDPGSEICVEAQHDSLSLQDSIRNTHRWDNQLHLTEFTVEDHVNGVWKRSMSELYFHTYGSAGILRETYRQIWNISDFSYQNIDRDVYGNFVIPITDKEDFSLKIKCFPNPSSNQLNIWVSGFQGGYEYSVWNVSGMRLKRGSGVAGRLEFLDISDLPSGIYLLSISGGGKSSSMRIVHE